MSVEGELLAEFFVLPPSNTNTEVETETESYKWTHQNTLLFLELYRKYRKEVGTMKIKNLKRMYEEIAKELQNLTKAKITAANCDNRWKVLERSYKKFIDDSKKTGRGRKTFEYADIMNDILGKKKNIHPVLLLSSGTVSKQNDEPLEEETNERSVSTFNEEQLQEPVALTSKSNEKLIKEKTTYQNKKQKYNILKEIRSDRKEYYNKRLQIEENKLKEKIRKNKLLEDRNKLLEKYIQKNGDMFQHF